MDSTHGLAAIASVANSQIGQQQQQQQQQQHHHQQYDDSPGDVHGNKRKAEDGSQGASSKSRRSRYISLACNECKRRKIKCNGQTPCQRCGNLNLECVYAPNCCNGFKDSQEYKDMAAHMASLQEQVNMLFDNLNNLRGSLGQPTPPVSQQIQQQPPPPPQQQQQQQPMSAQPQSNTPIDPSLQNHAFGLPRAPSAAPMSISPSQTKSRSFSQQQVQTSYRGPTSTEFSFGVADNSLQTMGITDGNAEHNGDGVHPLASLTSSDQMERNMQMIQDVHDEKDPIYTVTKEEALRLCRVYEEEVGVMYPVVNINTVMEYTERLYSFIDAARRNGLVQQGFPGADAIDDENTIILKMIIACASTMEHAGGSELGRNMFESPGVREAIRKAKEDYLITHKSPRLLVLTALYEFHCDNEVASWRIIGFATRRCLELALHRHETYEKILDPVERSQTVLLFWSVYILDRRFSFGTGMPFALQDTDVDPSVPKPEDRSSYISAMARFCEISSRVWRTVSKTPTAANDGSGTVNLPEMAYLDYQVIDWHRSIPPMLKFEHPSQPQSGPPPPRAGHRLRVILYLRANQMRIHIYRPVLHSATSIMQNRDQAQTSVDVAKDTIRVLTHISQTSDIYHAQQALFNPFLTGALAVLFLAVAHTPAEFAENVREEFYMALELVRVISKGSPISQRLWSTIRHLKEVAPKLGLVAVKENSTSQSSPQDFKQPLQLPTPQSMQSSQSQSQSQSQPHSQYSQPPKIDTDPSRSAAVAMAGLAGVSVDETDVYRGGSGGHAGPWTEHSSSPEGMAHDLTSLFEAAGGLQAMGQGHGISQQGGMNGNSSQLSVQELSQPVESSEIAAVVGQGGLTGMLDDLF